MPGLSPVSVPAPRWRVVALVALALLLVAALAVSVPPIVDDLQVEYFMDERDCAALTSLRGDFVDGDPQHCGGSTDSPIPFDDTTREDHARVAAGLQQSDTPIERTGGTYAGGLRSAWFMSNYGAPFATSWELIYDPYDLHPKTAGDQVTYTPVPGEDDWWFACCSD